MLHMMSYPNNSKKLMDNENQLRYCPLHGQAVKYLTGLIDNGCNSNSDYDDQSEAVLWAKLSNAGRPKESIKIFLSPQKSSARLLVLIKDYDVCVLGNCELYFTNF